MKKIFLITLFCSLLTQSLVVLAGDNNSISLEHVKKSFDLSLPNWGPYTTKYVGISHIPDRKKGIRFDVSVLAGYYRTKISIPNVLWDSGYHPWHASTHLDYYSYRYELEWKDRVYCDVSYSKIDDNARLIRSECVNNADLNQSLTLHILAYVDYPRHYGYKVELPDNAIWKNAVRYDPDQMTYNPPRYDHYLTYDGWLRGEIRSEEFVDGSAIGKGFGRNRGDRATYSFTIKETMPNPVMIIRYRSDKNSKVSLTISGDFDANFTLTGTGACTEKAIDLPSLTSKKYTITIASNGGDPVDFNGFVIVDKSERSRVKFYKAKKKFVPQIIEGPIPNSVILKYEDIDTYYGLAWDFDLAQQRQWYTNNLDKFFRQRVNDNVHLVLRDNDKGYFYDIYMRPITVEPRSRKAINAMVCSGTRKEVEAHLAKFKDLNCDQLYAAAKEKAIKIPSNPLGRPYVFSQEKMAATLFTNFIFPVYARGTNIIHLPPGRQWLSLYTWDAGFTGMGLSEIDCNAAMECLNQYVTEPGYQSAFMHHGTPLPTQVYLFQEIWNKTQSKEFLEFFYPRLRQLYRFYAGHIPYATTREFKSNLIKTWDYFYNSAGWDDYPAQSYVHAKKLEKTVAPVVNTSHCIMSAKILINAADALGLKNDIKEYKRDIKDFTQAIQNNAWDEEEGYFGYVIHDSLGNPLHIMRDENGRNFDMGFDGAYPFVAGICDNNQKEKIYSHLTTKGRLWTDIGLTAVDQTAPYFRVDGYWNGTVWMAHQWFFWKAMLDNGYSDFAYRIAKTGIDVWKREVDYSYNCYEHFLITTGRGVGWHQFGALSSPVLSWFSALHRPGRLTTGFNTWLEKQKWDRNNSKLTADLKVFLQKQSDKFTVIACMNPDHKYAVKWNNKDVKFEEKEPSLLFIEIPYNDSKGQLIVSSVENVK